ncbi:hypothetical protein LC612_30930 [Nostoc sp. CHAB 5834]|nr:hypothetical protein [Nostoc sp. CHAB 5834]
MYSPNIEAPEENTAVWLPNQRGFGSIEEPSEGKAIPLSSLNIDIPKAEEHYKDFVAFVESEFGIKTRWEGGLVLYMV